MTTPNVENLKDAVSRHAQPGFPESMIQSIADKVGWAARVSAVFGDPVSRDGVTVIPVAKVRWGFGGGGGQRASETGAPTDDSGGGGGAGVMASPLGFIEVRDGEAAFRRVIDPASYWPLLVAGALAFWIVARSLRLIFRK